MVSNEESVGWGISTPHEVNPTVTVVKATAHVIKFFIPNIFLVNNITVTTRCKDNLFFGEIAHFSE
jgi:hypothetical protein